jgi:tetratricopeptide (TPR) repeat protein
MELIKGVPLTKYCDDAKLTPKERLELFVPVCQAVQHAHQKGIIHRDLKPSNILVGLYDGRPVPKVIDFGVAKATGPQLSEQSIYTEVGTMIGTVEYMSPEQAELNNLDIDTRSDIYALGVILYELLTGGVPFSRQEMKAAGFAEMLRIIKEVEPPKPSTRLSGSGTLPSVAASRHTEPNKLTRLVRGELDWIVMKCLEKDRSRRYETANGLSLDIQRYLADEPVAAGPPSAAYRLRKFVRRNRPQVIAVSLVLLALLAGIAGTSLGLFEAKRQEQIARAETTEKEKARQAEADRAEGERVARVEAQAAEKLAGERLLQVNAEKKKVEEEKQISQAVRDFLQNKLLGQASVFAQANALVQAGGLAAEVRENPTIRELLDRSAKELTPDKIDGSFPNQPLVQAGILQTVGDTYMNVGEFEKAIGFLQRSMAMNRQFRGHDDLDTLSSMSDLALAYTLAMKLDLALPLYKETLELEKLKLGLDHPNTLTTMGGLGEAYGAAGKLDLALPLLEEALNLTKAKFGSADLNTFLAMETLGKAYMFAEKWNLSLPLFKQVLKLENDALGPNHPLTYRSMYHLGMAYRLAGKPELAVPLLQKAFELGKAMSGPDHINTLNSMSFLSKAYGDLQRLDEELRLIEEVLKLSKAKFGPNHPLTLMTMNDLAVAYMHAEKWNLALPLLEELVKLRKTQPGRDPHGTLIQMHNLASVYLKLGKRDLAVSLFEETWKRQKMTLGPDSFYALETMRGLAIAYQESGKLEQALPLFQENYKVKKAKLGPEHRVTIISMISLAGALQEAGKPLALPIYKDLLAKSRTALPKDGAHLGGLFAQLGYSLLQAKAFSEAEPLLRECLAIREKKEPEDWRTFDTKSLLGGAVLGQKKYADAEPLLLAGYEGMKEREKSIPEQTKIRLNEAVDRLVQLYEATGKKDEAAKWRLERAKYPEGAPKPQEKK